MIRLLDFRLQKIHGTVPKLIDLTKTYQDTTRLVIILPTYNKLVT